MTKYILEATTPAQIWLWKNIITKLEALGHHVMVCVHNKKNTIDLLQNLDWYDLKEDVKIMPKDSKSIGGKVVATIQNILWLEKEIKEYDPDICIGEFAMIFAAWLCEKPCIIFEDDEVTWMQRLFYKPFVTKVITPEKFRISFGKKHLRIPSYKELAYLHPSDFIPNPYVLKPLGLDVDSKFVLIRWNTWDAIHDVGQKGFDVDFIRDTIKQIVNCGCSVFISTEQELPDDLNDYKINVEPGDIHSVLYYATMLITDTQTMTTEAAVLGTPAIRANSFVGKNDMSNFIELEEDYELIWNYNDPKEAMLKAISILNIVDNIKDLWKDRQAKLLKDKVNATTVITSILDSYGKDKK